MLKMSVALFYAENIFIGSGPDVWIKSIPNISKRWPKKYPQWFIHNKWCFHNRLNKMYRGNLSFDKTSRNGMSGTSIVSSAKYKQEIHVVFRTLRIYWLRLHEHDSIIVFWYDLISSTFFFPRLFFFPLRFHYINCIQ